MTKNGMVTQKSSTTAKVQHTNMSLKDEDKPAAKRAKLTLDMVTSNEEKAYLCKICFQMFGDEASLADHASIHTDKKPHRCNVCGAIFMAEKDFANHMAKHVSSDNGTKQEPKRPESDTHWVRNHISASCARKRSTRRRSSWSTRRSTKSWRTTLCETSCRAWALTMRKTPRQRRAMVKKNRTSVSSVR